MEDWKTCKGFDNYSVSSDGRIRNDKTGCVLKPFKVGAIGNQYYAVDLHGTTRKIHRLVALAFISNPENKPQVDHINGDHFDNSVSNLEWVTGSENCIHAYSSLNKVRLTGHSNPYSKKVVRLEDGKVYGSLQEASRDVGLKGHSSISRCLNKYSKTAGGFHWAYYEEVS